MKNFIIGVDVGGTNLKFGLVKHPGKIIARSRLSTSPFISNKTKLIKAIIAEIKSLLEMNGIKSNQVKGIGLGLPGPVDALKGEVKYLPNIPGWGNVPLAKLISAKLKIPTFIDNDVNVIALGEWKYGAGKGYQNLVCMTLGTGVGGGLIFDGKLYRGYGYVAGEIGYMLLKDEYPHQSFRDGNAYLEYYVGNKHLVRKAKKVFKKDDIRLEDIYALASKGNALALKFWGRMGEQIGNVLVGVVNLLNPQLIIIGGGVSNTYPFIAPAIKKTINERAMKVHGKMVKVVRAKLGDDAGILGAQVLVTESLSR